MLQYFSMEINTFMRIIPNSKRLKNIQLIDKGWSRAKKYKITDISENNLLLRIANVDQYPKKKIEFET